jgi:hypothetical protein
MNEAQTPEAPARRARIRTRTRPGAALVRVLWAPGFVLALWAAQLLVAKLLAGPARAAAEAGMRGATWFDDGHRARAVAELFRVEPAVPAAIAMSLLASAILAGLFSLVAAPAILTRLDGERSLGWICGAIGRELPAMLVQTGYGLVFRAICLGLAAIPVSLLGAPGLPLAVLVGAFPVLVLDRARAAVVLDDARPYHPMTFLRAIGHLAKRPLWWLVGALLEALKLAVVMGALLLVIRAGPSPAAIWVARAAALAGLIVGLWRVSLAVEDRRAQ